jgi:hypothetical protein
MSADWFNDLRAKADCNLQRLGRKAFLEAPDD